MSALSVDIPELPLQILAVTEPNGQLANIDGGVYMNTGGSPSDSLSTLLISEGSNLADRLNAHFMTSSASLQQKSKSDLEKITMKLIEKQYLQDLKMAKIDI